MSENKQKLSAVAVAATLKQPEAVEDSRASFTFILETRQGYKAEGFYPNVTMEQYKIIVGALEGKFDQPQIIVAGQSLRM